MMDVCRLAWILYLEEDAGAARVAGADGGNERTGCL